MRFDIPINGKQDIIVLVILAVCLLGGIHRLMGFFRKSTPAGACCGSGHGPQTIGEAQNSCSGMDGDTQDNLPECCRKK